MENLNENVGGKIEIEFQDWLDTMNDKDYPERLTLETVIEYSQDTLRDYDLDDWIPQGQSTSESKKMEDFDLRKYLAENKLLKEDVLDKVIALSTKFAPPSKEKLLRDLMGEINSDPELKSAFQEFRDQDDFADERITAGRYSAGDILTGMEDYLFRKQRN